MVSRETNKAMALGVVGRMRVLEVGGAGVEEGEAAGGGFRRRKLNTYVQKVGYRKVCAAEVREREDDEDATDCERI